MPKTSKEERAEVYKDRRVQLFLSRFASGEIRELDPAYDPKRGYIYPVVEAILGKSSDTDEFLEHLFEVGILRRKLYDKIVHCPNCSSANVSVHYCCPHCKSFDVRKSSLIEHIPCGYIDTEERFEVEGKLMCQRCHRELTKPDVNFRKAGIWCTCNECDKSFDIPTTSHFCRECHKSFAFEEAFYKVAYSYSLGQDVMQETGLGMFLIAPIRDLLQSHGFEVESPGLLRGKSGTSHMFDIRASKKEKPQDITVIDLAATTDGVVSEQPVIAMFAKVFDAIPHRACLIAVPKICKGGKKLAALYKIKLIEAKNQKSVLTTLGTLISQDGPS